jgi:hypothetical protein
LALQIRALREIGCTKRSKADVVTPLSLTRPYSATGKPQGHRDYTSYSTGRDYYSDKDRGTRFSVGPSSTRRPTAKLVRQVLGAISEFDKAMTVAKLRGARERKRREAGKCEGRKSHAERNPELVALAKRLHRQKPKGGRMSLRAISAELAAQGFLNENGRPFAAASIKSMLN